MLKVCLKVVNVPKDRDRAIADAWVQRIPLRHGRKRAEKLQPAPKVADKRVDAAAVVIVYSEHINTSV
jgi:hypothetical protein